MKVTCDYCGSNIDDTLDKCPNCGAVNKHMMRSGNQVPKTIEELQQFIKEKDIPADKMRFFIGIDYKEPKAFGIFKNETSGIVTVYKNKASGERAIRYEGDDEAYAVNEIYQKMKAELLERKQADLNRSKGNTNSAPGKSTKSSPFGILVLAMVFIFMVVMLIFASVDSKRPNRGYYTYGDDRYYYDSDVWYIASATGWDRTTAPEDLAEDYADYYECRDYSSLDGDYAGDVEEFPTEAYNNDDDDDSWGDSNWDDDDWDYDYGGWDAGDSNWDSDW